MRAPRRLSAWGIVLVTALPLAWPRCARAEPSPGRETEAETKRRASALFSRGEALYRIGDHARAARLFEEAHALAPHPDILWNVARANERAGELARAANAYAEYLEGAAETAPDRREAASALERLARKVGRLDVHAPTGAAIAIDDAEVARASRYVAPGSHAVRATLGERVETRAVDVGAGEIRGLSLFVDATPPAAGALPVPAPSAPATAPSPDVPAARTRGWSPWVFAAGAGLSAVATGVTVAFAVDTQNARSRFDDAPSLEAFDDGRARQTRTNVLIGVSAGLWALTAATGLFLVDWSGGSASTAPGTKASVLAVPGGVVGRF